MFDLFLDPTLKQAFHQAILLGALVTARIMPIVQLAPFLGGKAVPQMVKMGLAIALTILVYPAVWLSGAAAALPDGTLAIAVLVLKEVLIGFIIGFVVALLFDAIRIAGQLIDTNSGVTQATAMVPQLPDRVSLSSNFLFQLAVVVFFVSGAHLIFLEALVMSFAHIPPQTIPLLDDGGAALAFGILRLSADSIALGTLLAFPVIAAILLTNIFLALVNKSAPQVNVFFLGMPVKALLAVVVILLGLDVLVGRFLDEFTFALDLLQRFIELMGGAP